MSTFGLVGGRPSRCRLVALMSVLALLLGGAPAQAAIPSAADSPKATPTTPDKGRLIASEQSRSGLTAQALGLGSGEELTVKDAITDADGTTHVRYDRTFNGLRVIGGDFVSHRDNAGAVKSVSWNTSGRVAVASITAKVTLASATAAGTRTASAVQESTAASRGEKVVYAGGATPTLAYDVLTVGVQEDQTPSRLHTIVDASTGATLTTFDEIQTGTGSGNSIYSGTVPIGTTGAGSSYEMRDAAGNHTRDLRGGAVDSRTAYPQGTPFTDTDNVWGNKLPSDSASAAVDVQFGVGKAFEYFKTVQGRNGIANNGVGVRSRVHYGTAMQNAFWNGEMLTFGDGRGGVNPVTSVDVTAHEMTHGVTMNSAKLVYTGESGGLNEATSDIFGTATEFFAKPLNKANYTIGEQIHLLSDNAVALRYMDQPSRDGSSRDCWSPTLGAQNVHSSSGPLNHWFYLASEGSGAKTVNGVAYNSPTCNGAAVSSIGRDKAAKIWYRTLTTYLTSNSTYADAREGAIRSAKDLYGTGSTECAGIASTFSAVAVTPRPGGQVCGVNAPPRVTDYNRDGRSDLLARDKAGTLWLYPSSPAGGFLSRRSMGAGWNRFNAIITPGDVTGDGNADVLARTASGRLLLYPGNGAGRFSAIRSMGLGWNGMTAISGAGEMTGDTQADILARDSTGRLWLYPVAGFGTFAGRRPVASGGWNTMTAFRGAGDLNGDGRDDVLARDSAGNMWIYQGNGNGRLGARTPNGAGWNAMSAMVAPGNWNRAGGNDLIVRDSAGTLWLYPGNNAGRFSARIKLGAGFKAYTIA